MKLEIPNLDNRKEYNAENDSVNETQLTEKNNTSITITSNNENDNLAIIKSNYHFCYRIQNILIFQLFEGSPILVFGPHGKNSFNYILKLKSACVSD